MIVTQVLAGLSLQGAEPPSSEPKQKLEQGTSAMVSICRKDQNLAVRKQRLLPSIRLGSTSLTGSLEIAYSDEYRENEYEPAAHATKLRVRLPSWFSTKTLSFIIKRGQAGWDCSLQASRCHSWHSETAWLVDEAVKGSKDTLQKLHPLLADGRLSLRDTFIAESGLEFTLMDVSKVRSINNPFTDCVLGRNICKGLAFVCISGHL